MTKTEWDWLTQDRNTMILEARVGQKVYYGAQVTRLNGHGFFAKEGHANPAARTFVPASSITTLLVEGHA